MLVSWIEWQPLALELSRETEPIGCVYMQKEVYFKELDHTMVEAWQVQNLMWEAGSLETQEGPVW